MMEQISLTCRCGTMMKRESYSPSTLTETALSFWLEHKTCVQSFALTTGPANTPSELFSALRPTALLAKVEGSLLPNLRVAIEAFSNLHQVGLPSLATIWINSSILWLTLKWPTGSTAETDAASGETQSSGHAPTPTGKA